MKKKRKRSYKKQSPLWKTLAKFFLSVVVLGCVFVLFLILIHDPDLSFNPIQNTLNGFFSHEGTPVGTLKPIETKKARVSAYVFSFWDLLIRRNNSEQSDRSYTIQVAIFIDKDQAEAFAQDLKDKSGLTFIIQHKGNLSLVRLGTYTTREEAQKDRENLSKKLHRDCIVVKM
jgi:hypothetical protein